MSPVSKFSSVLAWSNKFCEMSPCIVPLESHDCRANDIVVRVKSRLAVRSFICVYLKISYLCAVCIEVWLEIW